MVDSLRYSPSSLALILRVYVTRLDIKRKGEEVPGAIVALDYERRGNRHLSVQSEVTGTVPEGAAKGRESRDIALSERREGNYGRLGGQHIAPRAMSGGDAHTPRPHIACNTQ